jgi:hypothetical protein
VEAYPDHEALGVVAVDEQKLELVSEDHDELNLQTETTTVNNTGAVQQTQLELIINKI